MRNVLIIGGSGFVSGTVARAALARGDKVFTVTRGKRAAVPGVTTLVADRDDWPAFTEVLQGEGVPAVFDLVVDCIAFTPEHAGQDLEAFFPESGRARAKALVVLSSDFVCSAVDRPFGIDETYDRFDANPYGAGKRAVEEVLLEAAKERRLPVTVLRPCHIYGPGGLLGLLPRHGRDKELVDRLRRGEALKLIGGGHFLQQPVYVGDLAQVILACEGNTKVRGELFFVAGPEILESRRFYQVLGALLGVEVRIEEVSITDYLKEFPEHLPFCCHRVYSLAKLKEAGLPVPEVTVKDGLAKWLAQS